jgi:hypothetical protein
MPRELSRRLRSFPNCLSAPIPLLANSNVVDITIGRGEGFLDSFTGLVFFLLVGRLFQQRVFDRIAFDRTYRCFFPLSVWVERTAGPRDAAARTAQSR